MAAILYLALVALLIRQLALSRTPSGISRVSRWTFFIQSTLDSVSFAGHVTFAILSEGKPSVSLVAPAFLASILFFYEAVSVPSSLFIHLTRQISNSPFSSSRFKLRRTLHPRLSLPQLRSPTFQYRTHRMQIQHLQSTTLHAQLSNLRLYQRPSRNQRLPSPKLHHSGDSFCITYGRIHRRGYVCILSFTPRFV